MILPKAQVQCKTHSQSSIPSRSMTLKLACPTSPKLLTLRILAISHLHQPHQLCPLGQKLPPTLSERCKEEFQIKEHHRIQLEVAGMMWKLLKMKYLVSLMILQILLLICVLQQRQYNLFQISLRHLISTISRRDHHLNKTTQTTWCRIMEARDRE